MNTWAEVENEVYAYSHWINRLLSNKEQLPALDEYFVHDNQVHILGGLIFFRIEVPPGIQAILSERDLNAERVRIFSDPTIGSPPELIQMFRTRWIVTTNVFERWYQNAMTSTPERAQKFRGRNCRYIITSNWQLIVYEGKLTKR